jgi:hypothetical protein
MYGGYKMKNNFIVYFKKDRYNQNITYARCQNPFIGSKCFVTIEQAKTFAATQKNARIYKLNTGALIK